MLEETGQFEKVDVDMTLDLQKDLSNYDALFVYHGNDWNGSLNLFGGLAESPHADNFVRFCGFRGVVRSLAIPFPDYHKLMWEKIDSCQRNNRPMNQRWLDADWDNLKKMQESEVVKHPIVHDKIVLGDSHAISLYRPGWMMQSIPFKTLHGALQVGFGELLEDFFRACPQPSCVDLYFGNIDVRHHLCRYPEENYKAVAKLAVDYVGAALRLSERVSATVRIYAPLPIEDPKRVVPKTGWYKGTPFYGSWEERNKVRDRFIGELSSLVCFAGQGDKLDFIDWTDYLKNDKGELDFKFMERPKSIHLSREAYPYWQGKKYNEIPRRTLF